MRWRPSLVFVSRSEIWSSQQGQVEKLFVKILFLIIDQEMWRIFKRRESQVRL